MACKVTQRENGSVKDFTATVPESLRISRLSHTCSGSWASTRAPSGPAFALLAILDAASDDEMVAMKSKDEAGIVDGVEFTLR